MPALTRTACRTRVRTMLNEPTARFFTDAEINSWIDDGVRDISIKTFCYTIIGTAFSTTSAVSTYDFPTTLNTSNISTIAIKAIHDSNEISLEYVTPDLFGRLGTDNSTKFTCWQQKIIFTPIPQTTMAMTPYLVCEARITAA